MISKNLIQVKLVTLFFLVLIISTFFSACISDKNEKATADQPVTTVAFTAKAPPFNEDSAFMWVKKQVDFGARVPGTKAHAECAAYLEKTLKSFGLSVIVQNAPATAYDGKIFNVKNIIASYKPEMQKRVLLLAHWDSRHVSDNDKDNYSKPVIGADDGASGVAVLLEIARQISKADLKTGVDFFFSDLEDYGQPNDSELPAMRDSWCLGTQYWAKNLHVPGYTANYGILLDMVGAKGAVFPREGTGTYFAPDVINKVWSIGKNLGYGNYFVDQQTGNTTDDHLYVNTIAKIPCIDIVHMNPATDRYGEHHHTAKDNIDIIDKTTLKAVGQTVLEVLYQE
jgi:Zn-dependent M28 family amino/carboxypeptidase